MNRRELLLTLLAIPGSGTRVTMAEPAVVASCFGQATPFIADHRLHPAALTHERILDLVSAGEAMMGQTVFAADRPDGAENGRLTPHSVRSLGDAGVWVRDLRPGRRTLPIGVVGPVPRGISFGEDTLTVGAGDCAEHLAAGRIGAVCGLSAGLGWQLGLHRHAPFFVRLPGLACWECRYGGIHATGAAGNDRLEKAAAVTAATLASRGIQVIAAEHRAISAGLQRRDHRDKNDRRQHPGRLTAQ
jgi:hypothetical protein